MTRLARWWRFWVDLYSRREPAEGLASFRVAVGLVVVYSLLSIAAAGLVDVFWVDAAHGGYRDLGRGTQLVAWLGGPTPRVVYGVWIATLVGAACVTVGLGGRLVGFATLQGYLALIGLNGDVSGGYDLMLTNALWLLVLGDAGASLSVSCRLRTGRWITRAEIPAWPRYLAIFQLAAIYTTTGWHKLSADWTWAGGYSALYHVFQDPTWRRFDMDWTAWVYPLTQVATFVSWHFEALAVVLLLVYYYRYTRDRGGWLRRAANRFDLRIPFAAFGLALHAGILIALNVGPFSWVSLAYYLCLWHPDELAGAARRVASAVIGRVRAGPRFSVGT